MSELQLFRRIFFFLWELPVNVNQYWAAIGVFINRIFITTNETEVSLKSFLENLESSIDHIADKSPYIMLILGDFNAKLNSWYAYDNTYTEASKIDILTANWFQPNHKQTNSYFEQFFLFIDLSIYITTESSNRIRCLFFSSRTLSPSNKICQV